MKKTCVITGATSGIGWTVAHELAKRNFDLVVVGRSQEKGATLKASLKAQSPDVQVDYFIADLASIQQVKEVGHQIKEKYATIDVLINNAGGVFSNFELTKDGIERTIANNHLACFILTGLLLDNIKTSEDGRILIATSAAHYNGKMNFKSFTANKRYNIMKAYAQSKLANLMYMYVLAKKMTGTNVMVFGLHPGVVKTPIGSKAESRLHRFVWSVIAKIRGITPEQSARTYVRLATSQDIKEQHGLYFHAGKIKSSSKLSQNENLQKQLWEWSEEVIR